MERAISKEKKGRKKQCTTTESATKEKAGQDGLVLAFFAPHGHEYWTEAGKCNSKKYKQKKRRRQLFRASSIQLFLSLKLSFQSVYLNPQPPARQQTHNNYLWHKQACVSVCDTMCILYNLKLDCSIAIQLSLMPPLFFYLPVDRWLSAKWQCQSASRSGGGPDDWAEKEPTNEKRKKPYRSVSCSNWLTALAHSEKRVTQANINACQTIGGG